MQGNRILKKALEWRLNLPTLNTVLCSLMNQWNLFLDDVEDELGSVVCSLQLQKACFLLPTPLSYNL